MNQNSLKSHKFLSQRIRKCYKTLGTSEIISPLSPLSLIRMSYYANVIICEGEGAPLCANKCEFYAEINPIISIIIGNSSTLEVTKCTGCQINIGFGQK